MGNLAIWRSHQFEAEQRTKEVKETEKDLCRNKIEITTVHALKILPITPKDSSKSFLRGY